jgi:hypothetical protein
VPKKWSREEQELIRQLHGSKRDFESIHLPKPPASKDRKGDGGEMAPVKPDRPRQGEGGAAEPLTFDGG